jgi:hypothetical protein
MHCASCKSENQAEFTAEMMIHFSGLSNIDNPGVPAFPRVSVVGYFHFETAVERGIVAHYQGFGLLALWLFTVYHASHRIGVAHEV